MMTIGWFSNKNYFSSLDEESTMKTYKHNLSQRGFRVCFSQPHGTVIAVCPHAHVTSTLCVHG